MANARKTTTHQGPPRSISMGRLTKLLRQFDRTHGQFPEHHSEGVAVGLFILRSLGVTFEEAEKILGPFEERYKEMMRFQFESGSASTIERFSMRRSG